MEHLARVELGMTSEEFYKCTWYDWSLWVERILEQRKRRREDHEVVMEMFRQVLCYYYNWNRGNNPELMPSNFWKLSYDQDTRQDTEPTEEEKVKLQETIKRLESKSKRKRG
jgi:hypothetical protein